MCLLPTNSLVCGLAPDHSNVLPIQKAPLHSLARGLGLSLWLTPCEVSSLPWWKALSALQASVHAPLSNGNVLLSLLGTGGEPGAGRRDRALLLAPQFHRVKCCW